MRASILIPQWFPQDHLCFTVYACIDSNGVNFNPLKIKLSMTPTPVSQDTFEFI